MVQHFGGLCVELRESQIEFGKLAGALLSIRGDALREACFKPGKIALKARVQLRAFALRRLEKPGRSAFRHGTQSRRARRGALAQRLFQAARTAFERSHRAVRRPLYTQKGAVRFLVKSGESAARLAEQSAPSRALAGANLIQIAGAKIAERADAVPGLIFEGAPGLLQGGRDGGAPLGIYPDALGLKCAAVTARQTANGVVAGGAPLRGLGGDALVQFGGGRIDPRWNASLALFVFGPLEVVGSVLGRIVCGSLVAPCVELEQGRVGRSGQRANRAIVRRRMAAH